MDETTGIQLTEAFVEMADTLVDDFDVIDFLHRLTERCVQLLGIAAAGLLLADQREQLRVVAASSERTRLLELFQLHSNEGPGVDCFRTGRRISVPDVPSAGRWPRFAAAAAEVGFATVHTLPMRLRSEVIGALSLFDVDASALDEGKLRIGQALADVCTIGLLQQRAIRRREVLAEQLQTALNSRITIEQANGVLAERFQLDVGEAFATLRDHARRHNRRLSDVAQAVVDGTERIQPGPPGQAG